MKILKERKILVIAALVSIFSIILIIFVSQIENTDTENNLSGNKTVIQNDEQIELGSDSQGSEILDFASERESRFPALPELDLSTKDIQIDYETQGKKQNIFNQLLDTSHIKYDGEFEKYTYRGIEVSAPNTWTLIDENQDEFMTQLKSSVLDKDNISDSFLLYRQAVNSYSFATTLIIEEEEHEYWDIEYIGKTYEDICRDLTESNLFTLSDGTINSDVYDYYFVLENGLNKCYSLEHSKSLASDKSITIGLHLFPNDWGIGSTYYIETQIDASTKLGSEALLVLTSLSLY